MAMYKKENVILTEEDKLKGKELEIMGYEKVTKEDLKKEAEAALKKAKAKKEDPKAKKEDPKDKE